MNNETDKRVQYYMHNEISGEMFCTLFPNLSKRLVKLTNETENHNGFQFKTGLNEDSIPFNPIPGCRPGGIYFTDIDNIARWLDYNYEEMKYCRTVTLPPDCRVFVEGDKFKADKMILGERVEISDLSYWSDNDYCLNAVKQNAKSLKYVRDINHNIQLEGIIRNAPYTIKNLSYRGIQITKEMKMEVAKRYRSVGIMYLFENKIDIPIEVQLAAKLEWGDVNYLFKNKVDLAEEILISVRYQYRRQTTNVK